MGDGDGDAQAFRTAWWQRLLEEHSTYELTRFVVLRLLGLVYFAAFLSLETQLDPLIGARGLLPVQQFLAWDRAHLGASAYWRVPTLFWFGSTDTLMHVACWLGLVLSFAALAGVTNAIVQLALWALYLSFVHVGQIFYGYGWEFQLLETGFLTVFLCPVRSVSPFPKTSTPRIVVWLLRWVIFRVMVGAALIKLRGDPCWRDLTCLDYHFETQPNPNPLAWWLHNAPRPVHAIGVLFNHFVELVVPWFAFGFRRYRHAAGALLVALQIFLILSGNLSFLNWLTIVPALACFDDTALSIFVPTKWRARRLERLATLQPSRTQALVTRGLAILVAVLSVAPVLNLMSCQQTMNGSFDPLDIVNTYGAFGSVDRERFEVILEGTRDEASDPNARWEEYELPCMPGDPRRRPCLVTPYHYRLDWQMWFVGNDAARGEAIEQEPWLVHMVWQLLEGDASPRSLLLRDPFASAPPRWIRADIWRYAFTRSRKTSGAWWTRERAGVFLRPVSLEHAGLREYAQEYGWPDRPL
ncbi:MAG: lipase maturation factor family protein [Myxococcota bacterium]|nr:lipase maturation factor family protein [Myxococcota bacterium]